MGGVGRTEAEARPARVRACLCAQAARACVHQSLPRLASPRLASPRARAACAHRGREFDDNFCHFLTEQLVPLWETTRQFDPSFSKDNLCGCPFGARAPAVGAAAAAGTERGWLTV
jgi:hypothetical protein